MLQLFKTKHSKIRAVSRGARVSLLNEGDGYTAYMQCATTIKPLVGRLGKWCKFGDVFDGEAVSLSIPHDKMIEAMKVLQNHVSVVLVDTLTTHNATLFVAIVVLPADSVAVTAKNSLFDDEEPTPAQKPKRELF